MGSRPVAAPPVLELRGVTCRPPGAPEPLLREASLTLDAGQIGVLLGGNGAGKSTLLRAVAGLIPLDGGEVLLEGAPAKGEFDPARSALVLEEPGAQFVARDLRGELEFAAESRLLETRAIRDRVDRLLEVAGLGEMTGRDPHTLSAGEQQRTLFATALVSAPPLLLLDDPFLFLDAGGADALWTLLRRLVEDGEVSAALVAGHDGELAIRADRVGVLDGGRLRVWAPPGEALRGPLPEAVTVPFAVALERELPSLGVRLPEGGLDAEDLTRRLMEGLGP